MKKINKSKLVFGNKIGNATQRFALRYKRFFVKKFGDDSEVDYKIKAVDDFLLYKLFECKNIVPINAGDMPLVLNDDKAVVIGNIRMGYGHYRIAMAMVSAARALGYNPYWFDLSNFENSLCTKVLKYQDKLYSFASRLSQKSRIFNKFFWDPISMNYYKRIEGYAIDQRTTELFMPIFKNLPKKVPFVATHAFCSQGAIHAGMKNVVNAIPDNWPISIHYSEGSVHAVQTPSAYLGYKSLRSMNKRKKLQPLPAHAIYYAGHYVDHELVAYIEGDCANRLERAQKKFDKRYLISIGGAGAQRELTADIIKHFIPYIEKNSASLFINVGDHKNVIDYLLKKLANYKHLFNFFDDTYCELEAFVEKNKTQKTKGIYFIYNSNIFEAVYATNLLMRFVDCVITKPSEMAFYPVPKIIITRVGGHEMYGAIRTSEIGDGTYECSTKKEIFSMIDHFNNDNSLLKSMCYHIKINKIAGVYDGAYNVIKMALHMRENNGKYIENVIK